MRKGDVLSFSLILMLNFVQKCVTFPLKWDELLLSEDKLNGFWRPIQLSCIELSVLYNVETVSRCACIIAWIFSQQWIVESIWYLRLII